MIRVCRSVPECAGGGTPKSVVISRACADLCRCAGNSAHARTYTGIPSLPGTPAHITHLCNYPPHLTLCRGRHTLAHSGTQGRILWV